jgi:hypothetical protein
MKNMVIAKTWAFHGVTHVLGASIGKYLDRKAGQRARAEAPEDDLVSVRAGTLDDEPADDDDDEAEVSAQEQGMTY